jgi:hypothetical protein
MNYANNSPMIDDVLGLDQSDHDCFAEVAEVLLRHGKLERFDIALRHGHFDIADDEFLVEANDPMTRTLSIKPYRSEDLSPNIRIRETVWSLTTDAATASQRCKQGCFVDLKDKHSAQHIYRP